MLALSRRQLVFLSLGNRAWGSLAPFAAQTLPTVAGAGSSPPLHSISTSERKRAAVTSEMLRVDHAGEVGAVSIYAGQRWALAGGGCDAATEASLAHMQAQEVAHEAALAELLRSRRARPSALLPLWRAAGWALGVATATLGPQAAMACTVAVETSIGGHYNSQLRTLLSRGLRESDAELADVFRRHRDEELQHLETANAAGAARAPASEALSAVIQTGCSVAITIAKHI